MQDELIYEYPSSLEKIIHGTEALGFDMPSEPKTGALLKTLAASKANGTFLEIGTGTGLSAAWILKGMDKNSTLTSLDNNDKTQSVALEYLGDDPRFNVICTDAGIWLEKNQDKRYDFIFADALPGKFTHLQLALNILNVGGIYVIDDLLPQANWPEGHAPRVPELIDQIEKIPGFTSVRMEWASGLMLVVKTA